MLEAGAGGSAMYELYGTLQTGTCAIQAALEEAGAPYRMIEVTTKKGEHRTEAYRAVNPRQQVPALRLPDGSVVTEGPAILMHIADAHPHRLLAPPPGSSKRAQLDRWLVFFCANVYEGELRKLFGSRYTTDPAGVEAVQASARAYVERHYRIFEEDVAGSPFFFGPDLTVLDIYVWMLAEWMERDWIEANCPRIAALARAVRGRPLIAPIHAANFGSS
jgi:glutathione S-transferase